MAEIKGKNHLKIWLVFWVFFICLTDPYSFSEGLKEPIPVFVSIQPQVTFVERIGGGRVAAVALVLPGESPETYSPTPAQMAALSKAKIFFRIGVPFEKSLLSRIKTVAKQINVVDTREGIPLRKMESHPEDIEETGKEVGAHEYGYEGDDPHIWMSPVLVQKQAKTIYSALLAIDPEGKKQYDENYAKLISDLGILDRKLQTALAPVKGGMLFVFHPSFGYFTDRYGLKQIAVETEGKTPKGKALSRFIKLAKEKKVRVIFVQPQFDQSAAQKIARAINGAVIPLDPLSRDYFVNMESMADEIARVLIK